MNNVLLTFDYEIYFDGSNQYEALLENTERILEISKLHGVKLVFFIDVLYLIKLEELGLTDNYNLVKKQIQTMQVEGHELQYHYHPHWIHAEFTPASNSWKFEKSEFSFSDICVKFGPEFSVKNFKDGLAYLKENFQTEVLAYRAGGLSIDFNQKEHIDCLIDSKISFDSSVMPGLYLDGKYLQSNHPYNLKSEWMIASDSGFFNYSSEEKNTIREIPVMTIRKSDVNKIERIHASVFYRLLSQFNKSRAEISESKGKPLDLELSTTFYPMSITFDRSHINDMVFMKLFTKTYFKKKGPIICILSHPKSFYKSSFELFNTYLNWILSNKQNIRVCGFTELN